MYNFKNVFFLVFFDGGDDFELLYLCYPIEINLWL